MYKCKIVMYADANVLAYFVKSVIKQSLMKINRLKIRYQN